MKVIITEIQNPSEALAALGLTRWLADLSIDSDITGVPLEISHKMLSGEMGTPKPAAPVAFAPPAKTGRPKKYAKKPAAESKRTAEAIVEKASRKPKASSSVTIAPRESRAVESPRMSSDAPRLTIRQRILNVLQDGPRRVSQIRTEPGMGGIDISQHLYLIKKDGLVTFDDETGEYTLVAA